MTRDGDARNPIVSPDGKVVYGTAQRSGSPKVMKISADGGPATPVTDGYFRAQGVSPDGTRLLGITWSEHDRRAMLATLTVADGTVQLLPQLPPSTMFMPDGGFAFMRRTLGKAVLLLQPANGGPARPLTPPTEDTILGAAASRDGRVAFSRGRSVSDVVLIKAPQAR